jgi:hypothetical protein
LSAALNFIRGGMADLWGSENVRAANNGSGVRKIEISAKAAM